MGGTFDPIHLGHLVMAEEAKSQLDLEEVLFIPAGSPWMKANTEVSPAHHRLAMVKLATSEKPYFKVDAMEIERSGPTYTAETLQILRRAYGSGTQMFFIMGMDSARNFPQWKDPEKILALASLVLVTRPGTPIVDISLLADGNNSESGRIRVLDNVLVGISGKELRAKVAKRESIRDSVSDVVEKYIFEHTLYSVASDNE